MFKQNKYKSKQVVEEQLALHSTQRDASWSFNEVKQFNDDFAHCWVSQS